MSAKVEMRTFKVVLDMRLNAGSESIMTLAIREYVLETYPQFQVVEHTVKGEVFTLIRDCSKLICVEVNNREMSYQYYDISIGSYSKVAPFYQMNQIGAALKAWRLYD